MIEVFEKYEFRTGRLISLSKSRYRKAHPDQTIIFNSTLKVDGDIIIQGCDINLSIEKCKLVEIAKEINQDIIIAYEMDTTDAYKITKEGDLIELSRN